MKNSISFLSVSLVSACFVSVTLLSSCSNEQSVEPVVGKVHALADGPTLRINPPKFYPTAGQPGISNNLQGWTGYAPSNSIYGVSTLTHLGGDISKAWAEPLPEPSAGAKTILTTSTGTSAQGYSSYYSGKIENLIPGQKYKITFQVSSSSVHGISQYGTSAEVNLNLVEDLAPNPEWVHSIKKVVDLKNKPSQWVTETITFIAPKLETHIEFRNNSPWGIQTFTNLYVGPGAIQKVSGPDIQQL